MGGESRSSWKVAGVGGRRVGILERRGDRRGDGVYRSVRCRVGRGFDRSSGSHQRRGVVVRSVSEVSALGRGTGVERDERSEQLSVGGARGWITGVWIACVVLVEQNKGVQSRPARVDVVGGPSGRGEPDFRPDIDAKGGSGAESGADVQLRRGRRGLLRRRRWCAPADGNSVRSGVFARK